VAVSNGWGPLFKLALGSVQGEPKFSRKASEESLAPRPAKTRHCCGSTHEDLPMGQPLKSKIPMANNRQGRMDCFQEIKQLKVKI
jgi:hypothetical protein